MLRAPAVAGRFYASQPHRLKAAINHYLDQADIPVSSGSIKCIIVPHAGYMYSGGVAAYAYKALESHKEHQNFSRVILLGPAHTKYVAAPVTDSHAYWQTPLGKVKLFQSAFDSDPEAHQYEHCLEVQLPFLQTIFPRLEIMPFVVSEMEDVSIFIHKLIPLLDQKTLLLISTDLSHYNTYKVAVKKDLTTIEAILALDAISLKDNGDACGKTAVLMALEIAKKRGWKVRKLAYQNSGDVSGDKTSVVGYASFAFYA